MKRWLKRRAEKRAARERRCRIDEEWCGYFIGRRVCSTHNVVWDDGGPCPRLGEEPGIHPFTWTRDLEGSRY